MQPERRDRRRNETKEEIKETGRQLLAESGASGLSLRAIAKRMGMTAPGLYHYFSSINDLITALILDAFTQLAEAVEKADADAASRGTAVRLAAVAHTWRRWAVEHPIDFQLLYGSPIPTYEQPTDTTYPAGTTKLHRHRKYLRAGDRARRDRAAGGVSTAAARDRAVARRADRGGGSRSSAPRALSGRDFLGAAARAHHARTLSPHPAGHRGCRRALRPRGWARSSARSASHQPSRRKP